MERMTPEEAVEQVRRFLEFDTFAGVGEKPSKTFEAMRVVMADYERLRADLAAAKKVEGHQMTMGVGDGSGNLFVHGDYDSIKAAQAKIIALGEGYHAACRLLDALHPGLKKLDTIDGVITQIDNVTAGLKASLTAAQARAEKAEGEIARMLKDGLCKEDAPCVEWHDMKSQLSAAQARVKELEAEIERLKSSGTKDTPVPADECCKIPSFRGAPLCTERAFSDRPSCSEVGKCQREPGHDT